jgi:uncharacterized protein (DUF1800 family)
MSTPTPTLPTLPTLATTVATSALLAACGGGDGDQANADGSTSADTSGLRVQATAFAPTSTSGLSAAQAWRFLDQSTMGPTVADIGTLRSQGYQLWLSRQFSMAPTSFLQHALKLMDASSGITRAMLPNWDILLRSAWMKNALTAPDQLRQRVTFALSEIMVASAVGALAESPIVCTSYLETLSKNAFGTMRALLMDVSRHPAMGRYLTHFGNDRPRGESHPDQNYAREILQLFSIGVNMLDTSGRTKLDTKGKPIPAYTNNDIIVMSHVFTGWSYPANADRPITWPGNVRKFDPDYEIRPVGTASIGFNAWYLDVADPRQGLLMEGWNDYHATQQDLLDNAELKAAQAQTGGIFDGSGNVKLLGQWFKLGATPQASLEAALTVLLQHPNIAPFIAKQMIQRLVTSNPSDGFVYRAATAFKNAGFNLRTLVSTILLDTEARTPPTASTAGKVREPALRVTHLLRAFGPVSKTGDFLPYNTAGIGQQPMFAPSVFNFFRPGFKAPNSAMARQGKVSPEMQIVNETSVANYANGIHDVVFNGIGHWVALSPDNKPIYFYPAAITYDIPRYQAYMDATPRISDGRRENTGTPYSYIKEADGKPKMFDDIDMALTGQPKSATTAALVEWVCDSLLGGAVSTGLRSKLVAFDSTNSFSNGTLIADDNIRARRLILAVMISPEYLIQK